MKNNFTILAVFFLVSNFSAQPLKPAEVPESVVSALHTLYGNAKGVEWEKEKFGHYQATFLNSSKTITAVFNANGLLQRTMEPLPAKQVPVEILDHVKKLLEGYKLDKSYVVKTPDDKTMYLLLVKKGNDVRYLTFNSEYNYLGENYFDDRKERK